ncbi:hypothetical protein GQ464_016550 [Rhodocaloribacter litoris]|uniref:hypothetical protein n=1 Tax=Rhodocaloribacter litoris TaxID=2558931 RepID=UPI00141DAAFF|nr:hypothetical protein [Rhodocaloribacter litoris]QXD15001.1 hypothetical protein GQ464_016550 [Rhodocaloribacter litoris]GIV62211.1 MAG: hypothetical protein KatS3mg044_1077 [Rhodothermaceae bacterium]
METLLLDLIPHAPQMGLYVRPHIPADKLRNALRDYAETIQAGDVLALYDATLMGSARDGAVFTADRFVFQNNNLEPPQEVRYADLVRVVTTKKFLGGRKVEIDVNRGRATVTLTIDFSGKPEAAEYVARFLNEAMLHGAMEEMEGRARETERVFPRPGIRTDLEAVRAALDELHEQELLSAEDWHKLRRCIGLE